MELMPTATMDLGSCKQDEMSGAVAAVATKDAKANAKTLGDKIAAEMKVFDGVVEDVKSKLSLEVAFEERCRQVVAAAAELFGVAPTWTAFYREVIGGGGVVSMLFKTAEERDCFEGTEQYNQVFEMLTTLRSRDLPENDPTEKQRMITIRLPMTLHKAICDEANELQVSVNKLCISRMLQPLDSRTIPVCKNKRRGRRPGAAPIGRPVQSLGGQGLSA
jgi:predicted HicB family RNase H-like nuclease